MDKGTAASEHDSADDCKFCGRGKYLDSLGAISETQCMSCPKGKSSPSQGAPSHCEGCQEGSYAPGEGYAMCVICPPFQTSRADQSGCMTTSGYYRDDSAEMSVQVPTGVSTDTPGMDLQTLNLLPGFWRTTLNSTRILPCVNPRHCKGGANITDLCSEGYTGPLCAVCASGYAATGSGKSLECNVCTGSAKATIIAYVMLLIMMPLVCLLSYKLFRHKYGTASAASRRNSYRAHSSSFLEKLSEARISIENAQAKYNILMRAKGPILKVLVSFYQVITMLPFVLDLTFPPVFTMVSNFFGSIVNLNFVTLMPIGCIMQSDFHHVMMGYTLIPLAVGMVMGLAFGILKLRSETKRLSNKIFSAFLFMTFLILPSVSIQIFATFACREFDSGYGRFLKVDYSINCDDPSRNFYWYYAVLMGFIYPIGIPILYWCLLKNAQSKMLLDPGQHGLIGMSAWKRRSKPAEKEEENIEFNLADGEETQPLNDEPEDWHDWEKIDSLSEDDALDFAVYIRSKNEEDNPNMMRISFLYSMYEPQCYNFEVIETVRKLSLTGGLIFFNPGTASQIVVSMLMCLGSIRTYALYNPFVDPKIDIVAEVSQWSLFFILFGALLLRVNVDGESAQEQGYFDAALVLVNFTPFLLPIIQQIAIVQRLKKIKGLDTIMSKVSVFLGFRNEEDMKRNLEEIKSKFSVWSKHKNNDEDDAEQGFVRGQRVANPMQSNQGLNLGTELSGIEMRNISTRNFESAGAIAALTAGSEKKQASKPPPTTQGSNVPNFTESEKKPANPPPTTRGSKVPLDTQKSLSGDSDEPE